MVLHQKRGSFWFVVIRIYTNIPLARSNIVLHINVGPFNVYVNGFTPKCGSLWFLAIWFLHQNVVPFGW